MIKDNFSDIIVLHCVEALGDHNTLIKNVKL